MHVQGSQGFEPLLSVGAALLYAGVSISMTFLVSWARHCDGGSLGIGCRCAHLLHGIRLPTASLIPAA